MSRPWNRPLVLAVAAAGIVVGAGCGVGEDARPRGLTQPVPGALQEAAPATTEQPPTGETVTIFLARRTADRLGIEPVQRSVDASDPAGAAIRAVLVPTSADESAAGLITPFGEGTGLIETVVGNGVLDIHLDALDGFPADPNSSDFQVAVAMLVCTASASFADIDAVLVSIRQDDGSYRPIAVRLPGQGAQPPEAGPVTCAQFRPFFVEPANAPADAGSASTTATGRPTGGTAGAPEGAGP